MLNPMSLKEAKQKAIDNAINRLKAADFQKQCNIAGLPQPENGAICFRAFGADMVLRCDDFSLATSDGVSVGPERQVLVLHYLLNEQPFSEGGELIAFRHFPGGQFYESPFQARTVVPLVKAIGNDLGKLKNALARFDTTPVDTGDIGARIHVMGKIYLTLIYRAGDEEFGPSANILFDACAAKVFAAEDAVAMASMACFRLIK